MATLALGSALLVFASMSASAECGGKHKHGNCPSYADIDADGDGAVTSEELYAFRAARMAKRAEDGHKMRNAKNAPSFEELDLDEDGNLSSEEFAEHHARCRGRKQD
jgi:hypothetical protein